jgi:hypothetical protein
MNSNEDQRALNRICLDLQKELGERQIRPPAVPDGPLAFCYPGAERPLLIFHHDTPLGCILRLDAPVTLKADWSIPGLSESLLREHGDWLFGRIERWDDGITIEHSIHADMPADRIAEIVLVLSDTALRLQRDLLQAGALTLPEEAA